MTGTEGIQLLQSFSNAVAELADAVSPSVVNIGTGRRSGTGVVWNGDGLIVTASHVLGGAEEPTVVLSDGRELKSKVVGRDRFTDVALLQVEGDGLKPIQPGSSVETKVGQFVLAMANAFGSKPAATWGIVTSRSRSMRGWWGITIEDAVVSDAKLNPGYSGGPLVDASGKMLGMNVAYFSGRGVAVPIDSLKDIVGKLSKDGRIKKGFLGVVVEPIELPHEVAQMQGVGQEEGLLVRAVEPGSPARNAGVTIGDVILRLGDAKATDEYQLHRALSGEVVGKSTGLWILRGERLTELTITPKEAAE
jgi:S1-C subfamily serine protease